jgi:formyl-CoA transferase
MAGPLAGLKVLELGQLVAGPFAARLLGEFGAEVIKIEPPGKGDPLRTWRKLHDGTSLWWRVQARNKLSVAVDLRVAAGQEIIRRLAKSSDILIENFKPGTMERWGLDYETLSANNPGLIMMRLSGFGQTGPMRDLPGFGAIGESMGGMRYLTGFEDRTPARMNLSIGDSLAGMHGVMGALMALHERNRSGQGQVIDTALYESVFNMMESLIPEYAYDGTIRERTGSNLSGIVPSNTYLSRDRVHVIIAANGDSIFVRLMNLIGRPDLASDPSLAHNAGRASRARELDEVIGRWCSSHDADEVIRLLRSANVPNGNIYSAADIYSDPQYRAREMIVERHLPDGQPISMPGIVPKLSRTAGEVGVPGPELGQHTHEILIRCGYSETEIERLSAQAVIQL